MIISYYKTCENVSTTAAVTVVYSLYLIELKLVITVVLVMMIIS